jgi:TP901 family phage tail tape measure protein
MSKFVLTAQLQLQAPSNVKQVVQQIQSQLQGVSVNIQVQGSPQAQKQLQQVTQQANQATTAAERMGKAFALSIRRFAAFSIATRAVGLFTSSLGNAVDSAIDFERQLIKVAQVTGKSIGQLRGLTKEITSLSTGFGVASSDLLEVSTILAQAGLTAEDTSVALRTLAKAALAPNFDSITETAEGAIAILAQFGQGVGALEKQLGSINAVAGAFAVEASDLIDVIRRTGGVFKASGGDLNELLALFTSVRATTRESAESIGTGLRTIFTRIQRPKTIEFLKQFGVELVDLNGKFVGPYEAIKRLSEALSGLGEGDLTFISIAEELGGFRQIGKVLPLLQQFSTAQQALNVAMKAGDSLTNDAASAQAALAIRILKVKEEFLALIRSMTETSTFQIMANTALSLASALIKIGDSIKPLLPMLAALAAFRLVKGMSGFFGGMISGASSGRTYNKGGKVLGFARGGLVPGSGNRDTVPAMLAPGEFVIRKSSVKKMGAGTLAAMNENRYAGGGLVIKDLQSDQFAGLFARPRGADQSGKPISIALNSVSGGKELLAAVGKPKSYFISNSDEASFVSEARSTLLNSIDSLSSRLGGPQVPSEELRQSLANSIGVEDIAGKMFEGVTRTTVGHFAGDSRGAWDIPRGSVNNTAAFNQLFNNGQPLPDIDYDAKLSENRPNRASLLNKAIASNIPSTEISLASFQRQQTTDELVQLQKSSRGKYTESLVKRRTELETAKNNAARYIEDKDTLDIILKRISKQAQMVSSALPASAATDVRKKINKNLGGLIQKFAVGGEAQAIADKLGKGKSRTWWSGQAYGKQLLTDTSLAGVWDAVTGQLVKLDPMQGKMLREMAMREQASARSQPALRQESEADLKARLEQERKATGDAAIARAKSMSADSDKSMIEIEQKNKTKKINESIRAQAKEVREATRDYRYRQRMKKFATGGGVGTDTVPALLTPGEFVVNRSSAQRIGYGNLHRMNKVGKYAKGGVVGPQRFFVGGVAEKDANRTSGFREIQSIDDAAKVMAETLKGLGPEIRNAILDKFKGIEEVAGGGKTSLGTQFKDTTRGQAIVASSGVSAMGLQIKGKSASANTNTVAHETGHLADAALAGKKGYASKTQGTFQFDLVEKVKPQMEAAFKASGMSAKQIETYLASNEELFAEFFAKASPEVRAIITSTTDSKLGMQKLAEHLEKAGHTYAGLEASDITGVKPPSATPTPSTKTSPKKPTGSSKTPKSPVVSPKTSPSTSGSNVGTSTGGQVGGMFNDVGANIAMVSAALSSMLPPLDENAGAFTKMAHSLVSLTTTVGGVIFALNQFGIQLKAGQVMDFFSGKGLPTKGISEAFNKITGKSGVGRVFRAATQGTMRGGLSAGQSAAQTAMTRTGVGGLTGRAATLAGQGAGKIGPVINNLSKLAGPALGVGIAFQAITGMIDSYTDYQGKLNKAVQDGNIAEAEKQATNKASSDAANTLGTSIIAASAMFGPWGLAVGAATAGIIKLAQVAGYGDSLVDFMSIFGGPTLNSVKSLAAAQAGAVKTQKALEEAQKVAATAMDDFKNGTISASDALAQIRAKTGEANSQMGRANTFAVDNSQNRSEFGRGAALRNIGALGGLNPFMETSWARNARLGKESADQINSAAKQQQEAFNIESPARQAAIRAGAARGKTRAEILKEATTSKDASGREVSLQQMISEQRQAGAKLQEAGDQEGAKAAFAAAKQMEEQLKQVNKEIENIEKEVKRQKDLYDAMNLGLRAATATSSALSATMDRFSAGLEVGGSTFVNDVAFLQESLSSAAQAMDPKQIKDAVSNVSSNLREFGVGDEYIKKFEGNIAAFTSAQQNYNKAFDNIKNSMAKADFQNLNADQLKDKFSEELTKGMADGQAKDDLRKVIQGLQLSETEVDQIIAGDLSVFGDKLSETQKKLLEDVQKIAQERAKAEQVLIDFTKKRIDAERNLVAAQQEALDLTLEGREVQAKYGGKAVSAEERRANILGKSNVEGNRLGLTAMRTGSIQELRARNAEIKGGFANIEARRQQQDGMSGKKGVEADESQKDLEKAYKTQVDTIRNLIKLEEEQLKITQEKNKLEKESMESLIKGDVEEFFKKQSAVGATAAIASGDTRLQNYYGAEALGMAYQDIQRQQEAGVQELYGQQLGGAGGLVESAAGAALSARGVTDMRAAQVMAGTTAEEEASKSRLRELGGMLGETGQLGTEMAEMQVTTATMNVTAAQVKFDETMARGRAAAEEGLAAENKTAAEFKSRGGMIYASRGMFIPRGTDTVPAMLTPGEFVVNRAAVQRDNNLQILQAMNSNSPAADAASAVGMAKGGMVQYFRDGGQAKGGGFFSGMFSGITDGLSKFISTFSSEISSAVDKLKGINITLNSNSNVNVNINDSSGILKMLKEDTRKEILSAIEREFKDSQGGSLKRNSSVLGS